MKPFCFGHASVMPKAATSVPCPFICSMTFHDSSDLRWLSRLMVISDNPFGIIALYSLNWDSAFIDFASFPNTHSSPHTRKCQAGRSCTTANLRMWKHMRMWFIFGTFISPPHFLVCVGCQSRRLAKRLFHSWLVQCAAAARFVLFTLGSSIAHFAESRMVKCSDV